MYPPLPPHQPVVSADAATLDESHYRRLSIGETIRAGDEAFLLVPNAHWAPTSCVGSKVTGRTHYRRANSLRAWCRVMPRVVKGWFV